MPLPAEDQWIEIVRDEIDPGALTRFVTSPAAGAIVLFLGTVRELTAGRRTLCLDYEAYPEMAIAKMRELACEAAQRWPLAKVALVHRLGRLELTEASVGVAVSGQHRRETFCAGQFLIDELKVRVPIWKKEHWDDGTTEWVHPDLNATGDESAG